MTYNKGEWIRYANENRTINKLNPLNKSQYYVYMLNWMIRRNLFNNESEWTDKILSYNSTIYNYYVNFSNIERPYKPGQILLMIEFFDNEKVPYYLRFDDIKDYDEKSFNYLNGYKYQMVNMYFPFKLFFSSTETDKITNALRSDKELCSYRYVTMNRDNLVYFIIQYKCKNYNNYKKKIKLLNVTPINISSNVIFPYYDGNIDSVETNEINLYVIACK